MRHFTTAAASFEAGHRIDGHQWCGEQAHGHRWTVRVTVSGGLDPKTMQVVDHGELAYDLGVVAREFERRDLGIMLPAVLATPEGLSTYVHERLVLKYPRIVAVEVDMGLNVTTRTEWDVR